MDRAHGLAGRGLAVSGWSSARIPSQLEQACYLPFLGAWVRASASAAARVASRAVGGEAGDQDPHVAR
jgi:hypothetical protein